MPKIKYHDPEQSAPAGTYVLEVYERPNDPDEPRNSPDLRVGNRWFTKRGLLVVAAQDERIEGRHVEGYYVICDDLTETIRL